METNLSDSCDKFCLATDTLLNITTDINELEDNALEIGCDISGGEIECSGPRYAADALGQICMFVCTAKCEVPSIENTENPGVAKNIQDEVKNVLSQAFEFPKS